jgi:hypothetical protein
VGFVATVLRVCLGMMVRWSSIFAVMREEEDLC